jgi:hypothetical protein
MRIACKTKQTFLFTTFLLLFAVASTHAQKVAVGTNLLYWATGTVNVSTEIAVGPKTTLDIAGTCNIPGLLYFGDKSFNRKLWHWTAQPELRFWHTEAFNRGFLGIHAGGGAFDAGGLDLPLGLAKNFGSHRYEGWMAGAGVSYGWQWLVSPHWNFEATFGFGYMYMKYNRFGGFDGAASTVMDERDTEYHYIGPTKIGLSFSYMFRSKK